MKTIGVGLIGLRHLHPEGYMALLAQVPQMKAVAFSESDAAVREKFATTHNLTGYSDWVDVIKRDDIDLVLIFLPHAECLAAVQAAAKAGKHVVVEKPMAATSQSISEMVEVCRRNCVILSTPYLWRYHPVAIEIKRLLQTGAIGEVIALEGRTAAGKPTRYLQISPWILQKEQSGGGAMHNLGVHWIDLFRWFLDDEVVSAYGEMKSIYPGIDVEDQALALITFSKGPKAFLDISYLVPDTYPHGRDLYIGIRGTKGTIAWSPAFEGTSDELFVCSEEGEYASAPLRKYLFDIQPAPGYCGILGVHYLRDLAQTINSGSKPVIPGDEGQKDMEVVETIYRSAASCRPVCKG